MAAPDLRTRLQRLRHTSQKALREIPPSVSTEVLVQRAEQARVRRSESNLRAALPGREIATPAGVFQLIESIYPLDFVHGPLPLADLFGRDRNIAARLARNPALAECDLRSLAFLDTETTGLAGGAGTLVFLVGVGVVEGNHFILRQYFLRDPAEEEALLTALMNALAPCTGWVTFNGRAFDLPLLEMRLTLNRQRSALNALRARPHLDLLMVARKLYQGRLPSCSLGHLEQHVLNIIREQDDVPGYLIPQMYLDYLRTGDAHEIHRIIYHNAIDILSMVTLAAHLLEVFSTPVVKTTDGRPFDCAQDRPFDFAQDKPPTVEVRSSHRKGIFDGQRSASLRESSTVSPSPEDWLRLGRWHDQEGRQAEAESAYRCALEGRLPLNARREGLSRLAGLLKRQDRRAEAEPFWQQWASFSVDNPQPCLELAKFYEWHAPNLPSAIEWTERALKIVSSWPPHWRREATIATVQHRLTRLKGKMAR
jgi:uncharacterized protein YprB with RNaseH-like and TPR domain